MRAAIHTGQSQGAQEEILTGAHAGRYKQLYVSPERLWSSRFRARLRDVDIARVVVDDATVSRSGATRSAPNTR